MMKQRAYPDVADVVTGTIVVTEDSIHFSIVKCKSQHSSYFSKYVLTSGCQPDTPRRLRDDCQCRWHHEDGRVWPIVGGRDRVCHHRGCVGLLDLASPGHELYASDLPRGGWTEQGCAHCRLCHEQPVYRPPNPGGSLRIGSLFCGYYLFPHRKHAYFHLHPVIETVENLHEPVNGKALKIGIADS